MFTLVIDLNYLALICRQLAMRQRVTYTLEMRRQNKIRYTAVVETVAIYVSISLSLTLCAFDMLRYFEMNVPGLKLSQ